MAFSDYLLEHDTCAPQGSHSTTFFITKKLDHSFFYVLPCLCAFIFTNIKTRGNGNTAMLSY
jgi:hypothetical protein